MLKNRKSYEEWRDDKKMELKTGKYKVIKLGTIRCNCYVIQYEDINILIDTSVKLERLW